MRTILTAFIALSLAAASSLAQAQVLDEPAPPPEDDGFDAGGWDETTAEVLTYGMPVLAYIITEVKDDDDGRKDLIWVVGVTNTIQGALKLAFKDTKYGGRPGSTHRYSFPSGHTANGIAIAEFLQERYGSAYGIPAYLATGFVIWERLNDKKHVARDIWAGAAIGFLSAEIITGHYRPGAKAEFAGVSVVPILGDEAVGVAFNYDW